MPPAMVTGYSDYMLKSSMANQKRRKESAAQAMQNSEASETLQERLISRNFQETERMELKDATEEDAIFDEVDGTISEDGSLQDDSETSSQDEAIEDDWQDILGNGQLMKKILRKGRDHNKPMKGDLCIVNIKGHLESDSSIMVENLRNFEMFVGEGDVIQGLDLVLVLMNLKELAEIKVHSRFAYGEKGNASKIPPNADIIYTVELLSINLNFDIWKLHASERISWSYKKRSRGNWWFMRSEMYHALECYKKALTLILNENDDCTDEMRALAVVLHNNMAATQLKLSMYQEALENVEYVLTYEPTNKKALFRKALIFTDLGEFKEAFTTYKLIKKLYPQTKHLESHITKLSKKILAITESQKNLYRKMLGIKAVEVSEDVKSEVESEIESKLENKMDKEYKIKLQTNKKIFWGLLGGTSAIICGIVVHKLMF